MRIAFFDSGIGGLTVLQQAMQLIPAADYIYYADTRNVPYGNKPREEVRKYILEAVAFLAEKNIKALVVACNTATAVAINELRSLYDFPIIGMEPAIKPAILSNSGKKILVMATPLTLKESKLETLIQTLDKNQRIEKIEMGGLVRYAEMLDFDSTEVQQYINEKLQSLSLQDYETIVLGCTHFIYYRNLIREITANKIAIIDGNEGTVRNLVKCLHNAHITSSITENHFVFYSSGVSETDERITVLMELLNTSAGC